MANGDAGDLFRGFGFGRQVNLRKFAESVLKDGYKRGRTLTIGNLSHFLGKGATSKRGFARNEPIVIDDDVILKYIYHPKAKKGAVVPVDKMNLLVKAVQRPKHIYIDKGPKNKDHLVFVGTIPTMKDKVIKAVIQTRYDKYGKTFHYVKSFGVVKKIDMNGKQYKKIK